VQQEALATRERAGQPEPEPWLRLRAANDRDAGRWAVVPGMAVRHTDPPPAVTSLPSQKYFRPGETDLDCPHIEPQFTTPKHFP
jgi:hypothetical protein